MADARQRGKDIQLRVAQLKTDLANAESTGDENKANSLRQKIPAYYFRNGICYALKRQPLIEKGTIIEKNCVAVVIERPVVNIDDTHELAYAEFLFLKNNR